MARIHLFELEDQPWFPPLLRDAGTAYLRKAAALTGQPGFMAPKLAELLRSSGARRLVDLCSWRGRAESSWAASQYAPPICWVTRAPASRASDPRMNQYLQGLTASRV